MREPADFSQALALANLPVRFLLEMATLAASGYASFRLASGVWTGLFLAVATPLSLAVAWGAFLAPRAPAALRGGVRLGMELLILGMGPVGLWLVGHHQLAVGLATVVALSLAITHLLGDPLVASGEGDG